VSLASRKATRGSEGRVEIEPSPGHQSTWWRSAPGLQEDELGHGAALAHLQQRAEGHSQLR
ncbi:hypothetical protein HaLaN_31810, partial [Haematococcus lacustris]